MTEKLLILLFAIDNDEVTRDQIREGLERSDVEHYEVFDNHVDLMEKFDDHVHIAIIDHHLDAGVTGFDVMEQILEINPSCYVIIISGNEDPKLMRQYWKKKAFSYIFKNDRDFEDQLVDDVNEAYRNINNMLDFFKDAIKRLDELKIPEHDGQRKLG